MRMSVGTGITLMAIGGVLAFAVRAPGAVEEYVSVMDLGLILIWTGVLVLVMQVVMHRPRRLRRRRDTMAYEDQWYEQDVHRPGYAGETRKLPTIRGRDGRDRRR
jgi:hypothetical protein